MSEPLFPSSATYEIPRPVEVYVVRRPRQRYWLHLLLLAATVFISEVQPSGSGTALILTHQAAFFQGADGPEMREGGWKNLMDRLGAELAADPVPQGA